MRCFLPYVQIKQILVDFVQSLYDFFQLILILSYSVWDPNDVERCITNTFIAIADLIDYFFQRYWRIDRI